VEPADLELPLRVYRLATVRVVASEHQANFVVDTGGEVISISQATANRLRSRGLAQDCAESVWLVGGTRTPS
jgi:hypothetical protein